MLVHLHNSCNIKVSKNIEDHKTDLCIVSSKQIGHEFIYKSDSIVEIYYQIHDPLSSGQCLNGFMQNDWNQGRLVYFQEYIYNLGFMISIPQKNLGPDLGTKNTCT